MLKRCKWLNRLWYNTKMSCRWLLSIVRTVEKYYNHWYCFAWKLFFGILLGSCWQTVWSYWSLLKFEGEDTLAKLLCSRIIVIYADYGPNQLSFSQVTLFLSKVPYSGLVLATTNSCHMLTACHYPVLRIQFVPRSLVPQEHGANIFVQVSCSTFRGTQWRGKSVCMLCWHTTVDSSGEIKGAAARASLVAHVLW